jgi:hypothetical protein
VPQTKTITTRKFDFKTIRGNNVPTISEVTYNVENGVVSGAAEGESATIDIFVKIPNQSTFSTVDPNNLYTDSKEIKDPVTGETVRTIKTYYYRVGKYDKNGKFQQTTYTREVDGLQETIDDYNNGNKNGLNNVTRVANKAATTEEGVDINNNTKNQTLLGQRNLGADALAVQDAVDNPLDINNSFKVASKEFRTEYGDYCYPSDMRNNKQDRIRFSMKSSEGANITVSLKKPSIKRRTGTPIAGSVTLPIQNGIVDRNAVDWNPGSLNSVSGAAIGGALSLMNSSNTKELGSNIEGIFKKIKSDLRADTSTYSNALKLYLAQEAVGVQGLLSRATGAVINPNLELLFNAPTLRPFTFTFKMSPRSASEAAQVKQIIRFFKQGMSVKKAQSNVFLKAPNIFDIEYQTHDGTTMIQHPSLNRIKECALTACDVEYTPDGTYMTFDDDSRTMTSYQMTLSFTELDPIYEDDYDDDNIKTNAEIQF